MPGHYPHGRGPDENAYVLLKVGVPLYGPITPFENLMRHCAAATSSSIAEVVRGLQRMHLNSHRSDPEILRCLDWIEARL